MAGPVGSPAAARARDWFDDLQGWLAAIDEHEAGQPDSAAETIASWPQERLADVLAYALELRNAMAVYRDRPTAVIKFRGRPLAPSQVEDLCRISKQERLRADLDRVLRRAAVLHADIAQFARELPLPSGGRDLLVRMSDGRQAAMNQGTAHWRFGREVLDALRPSPEGTGFSIAWYLATGGFLQDDRQLTLADEHLAAGRKRMPDDADLLFAGACALETLASRRVQGELNGIALPAGYTWNLRPPRPLEDDAIGLFRKVVAAQPNRPEARVRLARLAGTHGAHAEAAADLRVALGAPLPEPLAYMAWLFLGDEELALGHAEAAAASYERAAALSPDASSPVVALTRLARETGDRAGVLAALRRWWALPPNAPDPWREYYFMQGEDVPQRMRQMYLLAGERRQ
jgi:tetratricopeptide (TPR) repeat protein